MPVEISSSQLKELVDFIIDLKVRQETAENLLLRQGVAPDDIEKERRSVHAIVFGVQKASWIRTHLEQANGRDLSDLVRVLKSRPGNL